MMTLKLRGTKASASAASRGMIMIRVRMDISSRLPQSEIQHKSHTECEQERVGLDIAGLDQAQHAANDLRRSVRAAHDKPGDDPAVETRRYAGKHIVRADENRLVQLIKVKAIPHRAR